MSFASSSHAYPEEYLLGFGKLGPELVGRTLQIIPSQDRGFGISRIGEMCGIVESGALLLDQDFSIEIGDRAIEIGDHAFETSKPSTRFALGAGCPRASVAP